MKLILKIARAELRTLFYSPIAWVVIIALLIVSGMDFLTPLKDMARAQEVTVANSPGWPGHTESLTSGLLTSFRYKVLSYLYIFIPLITMGAINREVNSGTMNLLSSSPVGKREIVLGKYLGLSVFNVVLLSSVTILLATAYFSIMQAELALILSMMLGFFLLVSVYAAIGLYISSLTQYQILAGLVTFVVFFLLKVVGNLWQQYDFVRELTWFLSISGRVNNMMMGLITTRDIFYFLLLIALFIGLTMIKLKSGEESVKWSVSFAKSLTWLMVIVMLGYFSSRPGYIGYLDVTRGKLNTIDTATQAVLKKLDGSPVTVTLYVNLLGDNLMYGIPEARNKYIWSFWDRYIRFYPNIKFEYEYYYAVDKSDSSIYSFFPKKNIHQIARQIAKVRKLDVSMFQKPEEIYKKIDLTNEPHNLLMELAYKGKKSLLRTYKKIWPEEPNVSASIKAITSDRLPSIKFTTGHYERSPWHKGEREYGTHTNDKSSDVSLINQGVEVDTISLLQTPVPSNTDVLVVADPKSNFEAVEQEKIMRYLKEGGNALFYTEPGKQHILNHILNRIGVHINNGILVSPRKHVEYMDFIVPMNRAGNYMAKEAAMQAYQNFGNNGAEGSISGAGAINVLTRSDFTIEPILIMPGSMGLWIENGPFVKDSAAPVFASQEGDIRKEDYILAVKLTRTINNKEQRIVVTGDADFMSRRWNNGATIGNGIYSWLLYNEYPVYTRRYIPNDRYLSIGKNAGIIIYNVFLYVLPVLLIFLGAIVLIRRKRK